jgi:hypothetical protein
MQRCRTIVKIRNLKKAETEIKIGTINCKRVKEMTLNKKKRIATIVRAYYQCKSSKSRNNLFKYLSITGHRYHGKSQWRVHNFCMGGISCKQIIMEGKFLNLSTCTFK